MKKADGNMLFSTSMGNLATDIKIQECIVCPERVTYFINILIQGRNKKYVVRLFIGVGCNSKARNNPLFISEGTC